MFVRLLSLNWKIFVSNLNRFQLLLLIGYIMFLGIMTVNLVGTAIVVLLLETDPWMKTQIPWLTPEIYTFLLLVFANSYWVMHFSFTNLRLLNIAENRKLLGFGFPLKRLSKYLMIIGFCHPINIIYNFTWIVFLMIQVSHFYQVLVGIAAILFNYVLIYSIKQRFIKIVERRFIAVVVGFLLLIFGLFQAVSLFAEDSKEIFAEIIPRVETLNNFLSWSPGGLLVQTVTVDYGWVETAIIFGFISVLIGLILVDHFNKTCEGLINPTIKKVEQQTSKLWSFLRKVMGKNAGKYYYYVMIHPYNKLQLLTLAVVPVVYVPLLLQLKYSAAQTILIPTILAGIPVALLAMGMANMYGYENRELLMHLQFPIKLEKQLKERFLGVIILPLLVFYMITIFELLLIPQKVTFVISFVIFSMGYLIFVPLENLEWYRITIMSVVIVVIGVYLWRHMSFLVTLFKKQILTRLWTE